MKRLLNEKNIFLLDGFGALLTAVFLGVILPIFHQFIGMPISILYFLSSCGLVYAIYSLSCFFFADSNCKIFLQIIITANLCYCLLTALLVGIFWKELTGLAVAYFVIEILIILVVVWIEKKIFQNKFALRIANSNS